MINVFVLAFCVRLPGMARALRAQRPDAGAYLGLFESSSDESDSEFDIEAVDPLENPLDRYCKISLN